MKRFAVVLFVCFSFTSLYSQDAIVLKNEGNKAMAAQQWAVALAKYEKALTVWGKRPTDQAFKDQNDKARMDFKEAMKFMNMSLELNPNDEKAKTVKTNCQNQLNMLI